jgi:hypothetical protein
MEQNTEFESYEYPQIFAIQFEQMLQNYLYSHIGISIDGDIFTNALDLYHRINDVETFIFVYPETPYVIILYDRISIEIMWKIPNKGNQIIGKFMKYDDGWETIYWRGNNPIFEVYSIQYTYETLDYHPSEICESQIQEEEIYEEIHEKTHEKPQIQEKEIQEEEIQEEEIQEEEIQKETHKNTHIQEEVQKRYEEKKDQPLTFVGTREHIAQIRYQTLQNNLLIHNHAL